MLEPFIVLHEAVAAPAGVFRATVTRGDVMHVVAEQAAEVPRLLRERRAVIRIGVRAKQQRMAAPDAHVFAMPVALGEQVVGVHAQKAREGVPDARQRAALQDGLGAARALVAPCEERLVVHAMAEQPAAQVVQSADRDGRIEVDDRGVPHTG